MQQINGAGVRQVKIMNAGNTETGKLNDLWHFASGELRVRPSRLTAAIPMKNPYCSCKLTRSCHAGREIQHYMEIRPSVYRSPLGF